MKKFKLIERFSKALKDPERKSIPKILYEYTKYKLTRPEIAEQYFNKYLYCRFVKNPEDFIITNDYMFKVWRLNDASFYSIIRNKYITEVYFSRFGIPLVKNLAYNINSIFFENGSFQQIKKAEDFANFLKVLKDKGLWKQKALIIKKTEDSSQGNHIFRITKGDINDVSENLTKVFNQVIKSGFLYQDFLIQHPDMDKVNPNSVNTLRIDTFSNKEGIPRIFNVALRMSGGAYFLDSLPAGGLQVGVDLHTGILYREAFTDFEKVREARIVTTHPLTGLVFDGFEVPYFKEACKLALKAAFALPEIRIAGWDIAITKDGPIMIEGNNNPGIAFSEISQKGFRNNHVVKELLAEAIDIKS